MRKTAKRRIVCAAAAVTVALLALGIATGSSACPCGEPAVTESVGTPYGGVPVPTDSSVTVKVLRNPGFQSGYSFDKQGALWTSYYLFPCETRCETGNRPSWLSDPDVDRQVAEDAYAYNTTKYERGHMAPKYAIETRYGEEAMRETFRMSNVWPQRGDLNGGPWGRLEWLVAEAADCYADAPGGVWIITGPVFDKYLEQLPSDVEIPDAFYKIIIDETGDGSIQALAFIMPREASGNASDDEVRALLQPYLVSIDDIEEATGFDFLPDLDDETEQAIEASEWEALW